MHVTLATARQRAKTTARVMLGLFILWQLFYLATTNFIAFFTDASDKRPRDDPPIGTIPAIEPTAPAWCCNTGGMDDPFEVLTQVNRCYSLLTGQTQTWSLFGPTVTRQCIFPAVELRWDEDQPPSKSKVLRSENEPADLHRFFRAGNVRLRLYETSLEVVLARQQEETYDGMLQRWRGRIQAHLRVKGDAILAYLRWRVQAYREANPGVDMPKQVVFLVRRWRIVGPDEPPPLWRGPFIMPVARWQPHVVWETGYHPLEAYDPVTERFEGRRL
jgi:hypothetical protein